MTTPAQKLAGRIAVAILLVVLAAGSVFAAAATLPATSGPTLAEPSETESPKAKESPEADESPDADTAKDKAKDADEADDPDKAPDADGTPSAANLARIVARLAAAGITTTTGDLAALAAKVGVGGAVRVLRFAQASGKTPAEIGTFQANILAMREDGKGWGVIARELGLDIGPGNGSVMGQGHGQDTAAKAADRAARAEAKAARVAARAARGTGADD